MPKPFAAYDVDGTIFKSSLAEKVVESCIGARLFSAEAFGKALESRRHWQVQNAEGTYQAYLEKLVGALVGQMEGVEVEQFKAITASMIQEHTVRKFAFPRMLMSSLRETHYNVAISGSPDILVRPFLGDMPVAAAYGSHFEVRDGVFTGIAQPVGDKAAILRSLVDEGIVRVAGSVALGDTISDVGMLHSAEYAMMFNPSRTLVDYGKEFGWLKVQEVKDQVSLLGWNEQIQAYVEQDTRPLLAEIISKAYE